MVKKDILTYEIKSKMSDEALALYYLNLLNSKSKINLLNQLHDILVNTKNHYERDIVAQVLFCLKNQTSLNKFITAIKNQNTENYRGYLVLCCDAFECSKKLLFFTKLVLKENQYTTQNAVYVIKNIKIPFPKSQYFVALKLLKNHIDMFDDERINIVKDLFRYLKRFEKKYS